MIVVLVQSAAVKVDEKTYLRIWLIRSRYGPDGDEKAGGEVLVGGPAHQHRVAVEQHRERLLRGLFVEVVPDPRLRITVDAIE